MASHGLRIGSRLTETRAGVVSQCLSGLDSYHCSRTSLKMGLLYYGHYLTSSGMGRIPLTRLYLGKGGAVLGGLRPMQPRQKRRLKRLTTAGFISMRIAAAPIARCAAGLSAWAVGGSNRRTNASVMSAWKRSGAWWYAESGNRMLALRCAKYNRTFDQVFTRYQHQKAEGRESLKAPLWGVQELLTVVRIPSPRGLLGR